MNETENEGVWRSDTSTDPIEIWETTGYIEITIVSGKDEYNYTVPRKSVQDTSFKEFVLVCIKDGKIHKAEVFLNGGIKVPPSKAKDIVWNHVLSVRIVDVFS